MCVNVSQQAVHLREKATCRSRLEWKVALVACRLKTPKGLGARGARLVRRAIQLTMILLEILRRRGRG